MRCCADLPWGRLGLTICYDLRFPGALPRAGRGRRLLPRDPVRLHPADRRGALARADARPRHRERLLRVRRRARRQARERPRDLRPFAGRRPLGPHPGRRRHRARRGDGRDRSGGSGGGARAHSLAAARPALRDRRADGGADPSARGQGAPNDPLRAGLRQRPRVRKLVPEFRRLRQAGQARAGDLPGLRLGQGREGDHGAAAGRREASARRPPKPPAAAAAAPRRRKRRSR